VRINDYHKVVVIPAHNEANNIANLVAQAKEYGKVIVVDDGSTDRTAVEAALAGAIVLSNPPGSQYGDGFMRGVSAALSYGAKQIVTMDAGGSHDPNDLSVLLRHLVLPYMVVIGTRGTEGAKISQPLHRRLLTKAATYAMYRLTGQTIYDYSSFRAFTCNSARVVLSVAKDLPKRCHVFNPALAMAMAQQPLLRFIHVPINFRSTNSSLKPMDIIQAAWQLAVMLKAENIERTLRCLR